ncbi:MAG TPA: hypothetical protein VKB51_01080 [bacterium]|nr:hypothetical protein [bacterium]
MRTIALPDPPRGSSYAMLWVFGVAFGLIEAAVVVYLRALLGETGDSLFPMRLGLEPLQAHALQVELAREVATLALMLAPAWLFHPRPFLRFLAYMLVFGAWDLSYYAFLKVFLGWPAGLLTYDILFLLPTVWVAPVLCPVLISLAMIAFTTAYLWLARTRPLLAPGRVQWAVPLLGGALVLVAFMRDAGHYLGGGLPPRFAWAWFLAGLALAVAGGAHFLYDFARSPRRRIT